MSNLTEEEQNTLIFTVFLADGRPGVRDGVQLREPTMAQTVYIQTEQILQNVDVPPGPPLATNENIEQY
jgi:hypothetical protein